jgi:tetratricopeptide (TPR) repeat protein
MARHTNRSGGSNVAYAAQPLPSAALQAMRMACAAAGLAICLVLTPRVSVAVDTDDDPAAAKLDPDYAAGRKAIETKNWSAAIKSLSSAALRDTRNADIQNYLGYAYRNAGQMDLAFKHYGRALQLNPRHRGAHEYVGEAYLMVSNLPKAEEHLSKLQGICLLPCEEYDGLRKKIEIYRKATGK